MITSHNKDIDIFEYMKDKLEKGLSNIGKSHIRNEYKLKVYSQYFLPSLRFHLTVNDMSKTHLDDLDSLVHRHVKPWAGLPRPGTWSFIHMPEGANISTISALYLECHALAHLSSRLKADDGVNHCLDSRIERESNWSQKHSHTIQCEELFSDIKRQNPDVQPVEAKISLKKSLKEITSKFWHDRVKKLTVQGAFLDLLAAEKGATHWKSIMFDLPHSVCKFLINSCSDTLNHNSNLVRWGKRTNDRCPVCGNKETLQHVLNICSIYLEQGRFTWRHNNILNYIWSAIKEGLEAKEVEHSSKADLDDHKGSTVPVEYAVTNLKPDICVFLTTNVKLIIIELSVSFEPNISKMHDYKVNKYTPLLNDIREKGLEVYFLALEVGSRGYISQDNEKTLKSIHSMLFVKIPFKKFKSDISKLAIISSFVIFHAKSEPQWDKHPLLQI